MWAILCVLACVLGWYYWYRRPKNFPPGPRGVPILGKLLSIGSQNLGEIFLKWRSKYGPVMSARIGREDWVVLNNFEVIQKALVKQGKIFSGRDVTPLIHAMTGGGKGIVMMDYGHDWKVQRTFGIKILRGFGVGKQGMENNIIEEMEFLTERFKQSNAQPIDSKMFLTQAVSNVICNVVFGKRFDYEDKIFTRIMELFAESSSGVKAAVIAILNMAFWLRHLPFVRKYWVELDQETEEFLSYLQDYTNEHNESYDENNIRDFIDSYLKEMKANSDKSFELTQLYQYVRDLFEAGTETTSSTLQWCILAFITYPECQDKIFEEVATVMGEANPAMKHQSEMPYTCAFLQEIKRHRTLVPTSLAHRTSETVEFEGYTIPKNTPIIPNLWAVHHDPNLFKNPSEFKPERFIDGDGKFHKSPHVIPFSIGPRNCLGQQLADMELFIFLARIVQQFKISKPVGEKIPDFNSGVFALAYFSHPFKAIFTSRE